MPDRSARVLRADGIGAWWAQLTFGTRSPGRRIVLLALLGTLSGVGEAAVVVLVVALATGGTSERVPLIDHLALGSGELALYSLMVLASLAAAHYFAARAAARFAAEAERSVQQLLVSAFFRAPRAAQGASRIGELQDLVSGRAGVLAFGTQQAATAVATAVNLAVVVATALFVSLTTTLLLCAAMVVVLAVILPLRRRTRVAAQRTVAADTLMSAEITESAMAATELRVFGVVDAARERLEARIRATSAAFELVRRTSLARPPLTRDTALAMLIVALAVIVTRSDVSVATLGVSVVLVLRALAHAQGLAGVAMTMVERRANLEHIQQRLADWKPPVAQGTRPCPEVRRVRLQGVAHAYEPGVHALADVTLEISRGSMLGVVGATGAGKSTLAAVLLGLLRPTAGTVLVDDVPLEQILPDQWHARTAWLGQEPRLLSGTVRENVRFLRPWIDDDAIVAAAAAAGLSRELARWSDGLDHDVGPAGVALSGGERQRVALARAIAGRPDLLVLDEPTSALDAHTEAAVRVALDGMRGSAAVVVIAHRLSTIRTCDRVAVLEAGRLVALAEPRELEATNAWFRDALDLSAASEPLP